jgi:hypothetical protein
MFGSLLNLMDSPWFTQLHDWICETFFGGEAPDWLLYLHELLGVG